MGNSRKGGKSSLPANAIPFMDDGEKIHRIRQSLDKDPRTQGKSLVIGVGVYNHGRKAMEHGKTQIVRIDL